MTNGRYRILVVEDAVGVAAMYGELLSDEYEVTVCNSGEEVKALIEKDTHFDLAIMDIVLPPEDMKMSLEDCQRTGLRLMKEMIKHGLCPRFYVISVVKEIKDEIEELCHDAGVAVSVQYKLDCEPDELKEHTEGLLQQQLP